MEHIPQRGVRVIGRFEPPRSADSIKTAYDAGQEKSVYLELSKDDAKMIGQNWKQYPPKGLFNGNLFWTYKMDIEESECTLHGAYIDFKAHIARQDMKKGLPLSEKARQKISVLAVAAIVKSSDGKVAVRKRVGETFAPDWYDTSASGICIVKDEKTSHIKTMWSALERELELKETDVEEAVISGLTKSWDYGGLMVDYSVNAKLTAKQINRRLKESKSRKPNLTWLEIKDLPFFIRDNYDGCLDDLVGAAAVGLPAPYAKGLADMARDVGTQDAIVGI